MGKVTRAIYNYGLRKTKEAQQQRKERQRQAEEVKKEAQAAYYSGLKTGRVQAARQRGIAEGTRQAQPFMSRITAGMEAFERGGKAFLGDYDPLSIGSSTTSSKKRHKRKSGGTTVIVRVEGSRKKKRR